MSDESSTSTDAVGAAEAPNVDPARGDEQAQEKGDTDWKAEARKWEARAKENSEAREQLDAIREAEKTEIEKATDRAEKAEFAAQEARTEALRFRIAASHGIGDEDASLFLTGADEETLTRQAQRLSERASDTRKRGNIAPLEGRTNNITTGDAEGRTFVRDLFGSGG